MSSTRQLAAIMFTDIVGYTAMMGSDRQKAFAVLNKNRELQRPIIEQHNGRWIKELGDGVMASFSAVSDAVLAAIQIQQKSNAADDFRLRIGIHLGEMVFENNDVFGDGVNIASRIQSLANPGSIFISGKVYDDIKSQKEIQAIAVGKYALKNVKDQVEIFAISNTGVIIPDTSFGQNGEKKQSSVLVLPFINMSNDAEQEYFSDGLTEELISSLSRLKEIKVISRTTSMLYKNTTKDIRKISYETGADYIMEGSVRRHANNLRITAQFIDAARDAHLWADNYTGTLDDIFDIQEKVSVKITDALRVQLTAGDKETLRKRYTENTEAYQLYLKGRHFWKKRNADSLNKAIIFFESALKLDSNFALAWAGLADTYSLMGEYTNAPRRELLHSISVAVDNALRLDNNLAEAHVSNATSLMLNHWDWKNAEKEFQLGLQLRPNYSTGHHWYAELLLFTGRSAEAFREISKAVELDPVSPGILKDKGIFYYYNRRFDEAIEMAHKALELDPDFSTAYRLLSLAYTGKGQYEEAMEANQRWGQLTGNTAKTALALSDIYARIGRQQEAREIITEAVAAHTLTPNDYRNVALTYTTLGDIDKAFEWLEKSYSMHEESLSSLKVDHKLEPLRNDPRFDSLLMRIGLN